MVRNIVLSIGGAMIVFGIMAAVAGNIPVALFLVIWGAVFIFGILYERYGTKNIVEAAPEAKGWTRTSERFTDEKTGRSGTVWYKSLTGERLYVADSSKPAAPPKVEG